MDGFGGAGLSIMADPYQHLLPLLPEVEARVQGAGCLLGLDGTVDIICRPVFSRDGAGDAFTAFASMAGLGERITAADGKNAIVEIVKEQERVGGNGPIMAEALAASGLRVDYFGCLGDPDLHPAYSAFATRVGVHSLAAPAVTHALEFNNGKLMLAELSSYQKLDADLVRERFGVPAVAALLQPARLVGLLNWACLPGFDSIIEWLLDHVLPTVHGGRNRIYFFDLADPTMRPVQDLNVVLGLISRFGGHGRTVLGMNLNEAQQVAKALGMAEPDGGRESLCAALAAIREKLDLHLAVGHATDFAAVASAREAVAVAGPYTPRPLITTGAGDHFNAGFCLGLLGGLEGGDALALAGLYSGFYVREARPPRLAQVTEFIHSLSIQA